MISYYIARVVELAYTHDSKSCAVRLVGSTPTSGTKMETLIQIVGWMGTFLIVFAYFLVSSKRVNGNSKIYQAINLLGAIGVGINVFNQQAWPAFALQVVWGIIAITALIKKQKV